MPVIVAALAAAAVATPSADAAVDQRSNETQIIVTGARTEGSDDYGVKDQRTAARMALTLRETPQSVSVVTRAQIEDFQLTDINSLLATVPGINVLAGETDRYYYSARGFDIQTFQVDGVGLPFSFGIQTGSIDTAIFDRIEVGAARRACCRQPAIPPPSSISCASVPIASLKPQRMRNMARSTACVLMPTSVSR